MKKIKTNAILKQIKIFETELLKLKEIVKKAGLESTTQTLYEAIERFISCCDCSFSSNDVVRNMNVNFPEYTTEKVKNNVYVMLNRMMKKNLLKKKNHMYTKIA